MGGSYEMPPLFSTVHVNDFANAHIPFFGQGDDDIHISEKGG